MIHSSTFVRAIAFALLANVLLSIYVFVAREHEDSKYIPKSHRSALRSTINENGFKFYFALKDEYAGKVIVVPDDKTIDLAVMDRLTFVRPQIKPYRMELSPAQEIKLQKMMQLSPAEAKKLQKSGRAQSYLYMTRVRHPASVPTGREQSFFFIREADRSHQVFLMRGVLGLYFVPEEYLVE